MELDKKTFYNISYGVYAILAQEDQTINGCIVNTFTQITDETLCVSVSINKDSKTLQIIQNTGFFTCSILEENVSNETIGLLGYKTGHHTEKYRVGDLPMEGKFPYLDKESVAHIFCEVVNFILVDTHYIVLAKVVGTKETSKSTPLTYKYYQTVKKLKAPKGAPSYQAEEPKQDHNEIWTCTVCGYEHVGTFPDGFTCPICGVPESEFVKK